MIPAAAMAFFNKNRMHEALVGGHKVLEPTDCVGFRAFRRYCLHIEDWPHGLPKCRQRPRSVRGGAIAPEVSQGGEVMRIAMDKTVCDCVILRGD